ncbi:uncharacterized protein LOC111622783 [Centruroides sculpturatus]|uniref:uncharacterized protein LOC111622783 n=1 Tax=Centruroides sculpturatus TaxID=218467 RepID=UPI000C6D7984|nr:uncharacterized protein LOC111622783 [Centruroides sculpturatus]
MGYKLILFLGSVREGRNVARIAPFIKKNLEERGHNITVFDPIEMEFPMLKKPLHFYAPNETPPDWLVKYNKIVEDADGYVAITAEYNRCIAPALANMMDHFPIKSFKCKPCSIVCYSMGPFGGTQAAMQLRYFLGELGMVTPQFIFATPFVHQAFKEDGTPLTDKAQTGVEKLAKELEWYCAALKSHRDKYGSAE